MNTGRRNCNTTLELDEIFADKEFMDKWFSDMLEKGIDYEWYECCSNIFECKTMEERRDFMLEVHKDYMFEFSLGLIQKYILYKTYGNY